MSIRSVSKFVKYSLLGLIVTGCTTVDSGEVGVVKKFGKVQDTTLSSGRHGINPMTTKVISFSTRLKDVKEQIEATSKEGLRFKLDVSIQYRINPQQAPKIYKEIGTDERDILVPQFRSVVRQVTANYDASAVYSSQRQAVAEEIYSRLKNKIAPLGFTLEDVLLREVILPEELQSSIEQKLAAEQQSKKMEFILKQERQKAKKKKIRAQGIAEFQRIIAAGTSEDFLEWKAIQATEDLVTELSDSSNTKFIILGGGENGVPALIKPDSDEQE